MALRRLGNVLEVYISALVDIKRAVYQERAELVSGHDKFKTFQMQSFSVNGKSILQEEAKFKSGLIKVVLSIFPVISSLNNFLSFNFFR